MKKAVMYGAGNIGRGFIGKTFSDSGYEVCFVDVAKDIVRKINEDMCYPVKIVSNVTQQEVFVRNVRAVNGLDIDSVADEIAAADIMATAVGVNVLPRIIAPICAGLKKRFDSYGKPLNIIICENMLDADKYIRKLIEQEIGEAYKTVLDEKLGLIEASIGRMVPVMTDEMREGNPLKVWVEPYDELPVDKDAFIGGIPKLNRLLPFSPFGFYLKRKLFIHNMGHAICAYLGWQKGYEFIHECINDNEIRETVASAMKSSADALHNEYGIPIGEIYSNVYDILDRFGNISLGDTVVRVGRDPVRKLGINDRLVGAALYCEAQDVRADGIVRSIVAALLFDNADDEAAMKIQQLISEKGIETCLKQVCGLNENIPLFFKIIANYTSRFKQ